MKTRVLLLLAAAVCAAQSPNLGRIDFPTSGGPEAQKHFIHGMLLLHSFEYADARDEFQAASKLEPHFAMAYWGEALTYTHPLWVQQDLVSARATLARLGPTKEARLAFAPTEREKDFLRSVEALYGDGDKLTRDLAYAAALGKMHDKYPNDLEVASLYALALMGTCQYERQTPVYMRSAAIAEEVFAKNPEHPGAIHYLIHAYDDPVHAPLGLRAARVYGKVAGAASHAQHMPSHIFVALGMWDDVVAANIASAKTADDRVKAKGLSNSERSFHALLWLEYGYLQQGDVTKIGNSLPNMTSALQPHVADAKRVLDDAAQSARGLTQPASYVNQMRAVYASATDSWEMVAQPEPGGGMLSNIELLTTRGMIEAHQGKLDAARKTLAEAQAATSGEGGALHGGMARPSTANDKQTAQVMIQELQAVIMRAEGKRDAALELLAAAAKIEDGLSFEYGPPVPVKPVHELYGDMLLTDGFNELMRPASEGAPRNLDKIESELKEAKKQYEKAMERCPKRWLSSVGVSRAEEELGRVQGIRGGH